MSKHLGLDGYPRSRENDHLISKNVHALFATPTGREVIKYLRSVTIEAVTGAGASDAELRHLEGQRFLVGLIERRIAHGEKVNKNG